MQDEPFSARPVISLSYIYTVALCDFTTFIALRPSLKIHGNVPFLIDNNYAVCLAMNGDHLKALEVMMEIKPEALPEELRPTYIATMGLIYYRQGEPDLGRKLYEKSLNLFQPGSIPWLLGNLFLAVQEMDCGKREFAQQILVRVRDRVLKSNAIEVRTFLTFAEKKLQTA
jgi:tetratricopeptide (TPR) repeat protein